MKEEIKTEQGLYTPEFSCMDPKRLTKTNPQNITLSKSAVDLSNKKPITMKENKRLSKLEPKSLKKFRRKMKNRVSKKLRSGLSIKIFSIQISAQESRRKKKEYLDCLENNYEMLKEETNAWKKSFEQLGIDNQKIRENMEVLQSKHDLSKFLFKQIM